MTTQDLDTKNLQTALPSATTIMDSSTTSRRSRLMKAWCLPAENRTPEDVQILCEFGGTGISLDEAAIMLQLARVYRALEKLERLVYG